MFMALGISVTYLIGAYFPWDLISYICAIIPAIGLITTFLIPKSPIWLKNKGKTIEAMNSAIWLNNETIIDTLKNNNQDSTGTIETNVSDPEKSPEKYDSFLSKKNLKAVYY